MSDLARDTPVRTPVHLFEITGSAPVVTPTRLRAWQVGVALVFLLAAATAGLVVGPAGLSPTAVIEEVVGHCLPFLHLHAGLSATDRVVVWQLRLPRVVLAMLVGAMLAVAGASYQGVFSNPLADPYLLGVASGAGLGATVALVYASDLTHLWIDPLPLSAFLGATLAVAATLVLGRARGTSAAAPLLLAGVAVGALLTAVQTFLQQQNAPDLQVVYSWILGGLATAGWSEVLLVLPYVGLSMVVLVACRRLLDVLSVGDDESTTVGIHATRVRLVVIAAATLGTAAAVSVSGLIGFVGIIVPHGIRLLVGPSYRRIVPLAVCVGAGFLVLADLLARTVLSPAELPLGVVTAFVGAPFFLVVLRRARKAA